jgi:anti-sigma factor RsiW
MNPNHDEQELARWIDGEMTAVETTAFEARLSNEPALRGEADMLRSLHDALKQGFPVIESMPNGDFFNHQIMEQLRQETAPRAAAETAPSILSIVFSWFNSPLRLAIPALLAVAALQVTWMQPKAETVVLSTYAPMTGVQASTYHSPEADATVLILDGLTAIPDDKPMVGYRIERSETDHAVATTTMYSASGEVVAVLALNSRQQPRVLAR